MFCRPHGAQRPHNTDNANVSHGAHVVWAVDCCQLAIARAMCTDQSLRARPLPEVMNDDAYEQGQAEADEVWTFDQLFDDNDEEDGERGAK